MQPKLLGGGGGTLSHTIFSLFPKVLELRSKMGEKTVYNSFPI